MHIGVLTLDWPPRSGGMSRFAFETFSALAVRGHRVTVLAGRSAAACGHEEGCKGGSIAVVPGLIGDLSVDGSLLRAHDRGVDVWHAWELGLGGLARCTERPMFVTVHGNDLTMPQAFYRFTRSPLLHRLAGVMARPKWQRRMCGAALSRVAGFFANSHSTAETLLRMYPTVGNVEVVHCGVADRFFVEQGTRETGAAPRLLTVCGLSTIRKRKNVDGVLRALAKLRDSHEFFYDVCGDGDWRAELEMLAGSLGLGERVRFHGQVSDEALAEVYRHADLFVLAPHSDPSDVEGFGIVYLEANAAGVPVLAARGGGVTDAVCDGVSGYFADSSQPEDIATAIRQFLAGEVHFSEPQVRAWAEEHRYHRLVQRIEDSYEAALRRMLPLVAVEQ